MFIKNAKKIREMNYPKLFVCLIAYAVVCIQGNLFDLKTFKSDIFIEILDFFSGSTKVLENWPSTKISENEYKNVTIRHE